MGPSVREKPLRGKSLARRGRKLASIGGARVLRVRANSPQRVADNQ